MNIGWTAGPWRAIGLKQKAGSYRPLKIVGPDGKSIASVPATLSRNYEECQHNLALMTASPELLIGCKDLLTHLETGKGDKERMADYLRRAIAKAESDIKA